MSIMAAGLLLYREVDGQLQVLLAHLGGPFFARKDDGGWTIPKGELEPGEDPYAAAVREFAEELGSPPPPGPEIHLGEVAQSRAKTSLIWARRADFDPATITSNTFELEWPPRSGRRQSFPEVDRAAWFPMDLAREKLTAGLRPVIDLLLQQLSEPSFPP